MGIKIENSCSFEIKAVTWHKVCGFGEDIKIAPGKIGEVHSSNGLAIKGPTIHCQESAGDGTFFFQVTLFSPLVVANEDGWEIRITHYAYKPKNRQVA